MFFGPKFSTIVFSDTSIKLAVVKSVSNKFKVSFLAKKTLPAQTVFNGRIINSGLFKEALKTLFLENYDKIKTKNTVVGLNEQEMFITGVNFDRRPRHLDDEIRERISTNLPFDLKEATMTYREVSHRNFQVVAARTLELQLISNIFEDAGFSLKAIVPLPLIFLKLLDRKGSSYLFISSEEDLIFTLVVRGVVVFSSSLRLKKPLAESEKEITRFANEIIDEEYKNQNSEPLKAAFIHGAGTDFLKDFLSKQGFKAEIIFASDKSTAQAGNDGRDFGRAITLSLYDNSTLVLPKSKTSSDIQMKVKPPEKNKINPIYLFIPLLAIAALSIIIFWPNLKDIFVSESQDQNTLTPQKQTTDSATPKKEATSPAEKKVPAESTKTKESINKEDLKIQVLNGSGEAGAAGQARDFLISKGYKVEGVSNAENFNYQKTTIQIKNSQKEVTDLLTKDLKERYAITVGSPLSEDEPFDVVIIVGGE
jgi:hypothetical protein